MRSDLRCLKTNPMDRMPKSFYVNKVKKIEKIINKYGRTESLEDWTKYTKAKLDAYANKLYMVAQSIPLAEKI